MLRTHLLSCCLCLMGVLWIHSVTPGQTCGKLINYSPVINETWTIKDSPVCVKFASLQISGLTIHPGVQIVMDPGVEVRISTTITACGTAQQPIVFTAANATAGWKGILFSNSGAGSILSHCRIEHARSSGLRIINGTPVLNHCVIQNNTAAGNGGGLSISLASGSLTVSNCLITANDAASNGGAMYVSGAGTVTLDGCRILNNTANVSKAIKQVVAGGIYAAAAGRIVLRNCDVRGNICYSHDSRWYKTVCGYGGGIYASGSNLDLIGTTLVANHSHSHEAGSGGVNEYAHSYGGGIYFAGASSTLSLKNSILSGNVAGAYGTVSYPRGGALYLASGNATFENCTVVRNVANCATSGHPSGSAVYVNGGKVTGINMIVYHNSAPYHTIAPIAGSATLSYSDVQGGYTGEGNINLDPSLIPGCEMISPGSPCIDAGNPASQYDDKWFPPSQGTPTNDMGAHGGPGAGEMSGAYLSGFGNGQIGTAMNLNLLSLQEGGFAYRAGTSLGNTGFGIGTHEVGLRFDAILVASIRNLLPDIFQNYAGTLASNGRGSASIVIPNQPIYIGVTLYSAFLTHRPATPWVVESVSNTYAFTIK